MRAVAAFERWEDEPRARRQSAKLCLLLEEEAVAIISHCRQENAHLVRKYWRWQEARL